MPRDRDYDREYKNYQGTEKQKKRRAARNLARQRALRSGRVRLGDGKDIDHKDGNPLNNKSSNHQVKSKSSNRSFPRTKTSGKKNKND